MISAKLFGIKNNHCCLPQGLYLNNYFLQSADHLFGCVTIDYSHTKTSTEIVILWALVLGVKLDSEGREIFRRPLRPLDT